MSGVPSSKANAVGLHDDAVCSLALGVWKGPEDFLAGRHFKRFVPGRRARAVRAREAEWHRAVDTALHWAAAGGALERRRRREV